MGSIDKDTIQLQLEHMQLKHVGTGHPEISKLFACWLMRTSHV